MVYMYRKVTHIAPILPSILSHTLFSAHSSEKAAAKAKFIIIGDDDGDGSMEVGLNFKETELCLGLPGGGGDIGKTSGKRGFSETVDLKLNLLHSDDSDLKDNVENSASGVGEAVPIKDPVKPPAK